MCNTGVVFNMEPPLNYMLRASVEVLMSLIITGFSPQVCEAARLSRESMPAVIPDDIEAPPPPVFKPKCPYIPVLPSYRGVLSEEWWAEWPSHTVTGRVRSWIDHVKLLDISKQLGYPDLDYVEDLCYDLEHGVRIGCDGSGRLPGRCKNIASTYQYGRECSDALARWIEQKLVIGPMCESDLPKDAKISPISIELKPTAAARIIFDLSAPHLQEVDLSSTTVPSSVNSGIDGDQYKVTMSSVERVLTMLLKYGTSTYMAKQDW